MVGKPVYLDTSGVVAFMDRDDKCHEKAARAWSAVLSAKCGFVMTDYVRLECWSLLQTRLGIDAAKDFRLNVLPLCKLETVGQAGFELLSKQVILSRQRRLSLVDLSSFDCMTHLGLTRALAFDNQFVERGFVTPEHRDWSREGLMHC